MLLANATPFDPRNHLATGRQTKVLPHLATATFRPSLTATFRFCPLWWFEGTIGRLRFLPTEFAIYGVDMEPGGWLVTVGDGLMEACSVAY